MEMFPFAWEAGRLLTHCLSRIYKAKYMDDTPADNKRKDAKQPLEIPQSGKDKDPKDPKVAGRSRARSIWGRKK
jgi:hypothetical protein